jgi:hypothetical protein
MPGSGARAGNAGDDIGGLKTALPGTLGAWATLAMWLGDGVA